MQAVFGRSRGGTKSLFQEGNTDSLRAHNLFQRCGGPVSPFHHLGKQRQTDADDFSLLSQGTNRLLQELTLLAVHFARGLGQSAEGPPEGRQDLSRVVQV